MKHSAQRGFTLIELVVVITILGILAAFAVPRFMSLDKSARVATLNGMAGTAKSAAAMAHSVWMAAGNAPATISVDGQNVNMTNGYPAATAAGLGRTINDMTGFTPVYTAGAPAVATFQKAGAPVPATCSFTYTDAVNSFTPPVIGAINQAGC